MDHRDHREQLQEFVVVHGTADARIVRGRIAIHPQQTLADVGESLLLVLLARTCETIDRHLRRVALTQGQRSVDQRRPIAAEPCHRAQPVGNALGRLERSVERITLQHLL